MTVTPRPMGTPDLAGLLATPPRPRPAPAEPVADLGDTDTFDVAVAEWANAYADLTERDHAALVADRGAPAAS